MNIEYTLRKEALVIIIQYYSENKVICTNESRRQLYHAEKESLYKIEKKNHNERHHFRSCNIMLN